MIYGVLITSWRTGIENKFTKIFLVISTSKRLSESVINVSLMLCPLLTNMVFFGWSLFKLMYLNATIIFPSQIKSTKTFCQWINRSLSFILQDYNTSMTISWKAWPSLLCCLSLCATGGQHLFFRTRYNIRLLSWAELKRDKHKMTCFSCCVYDN